MGCAFRAALALLLCLMLAPAAVAGDRNAPMPVGGPTTTPIGWLMFCRDNGAECRPPAPAPLPAPPVAFTPALRAQALKVNAAVNAAVAPASDRLLYGVEERWTYPAGGRGDCEDYALEKRRTLAAAGVPLGDLLLTVVRKANGEGHAVLTLRTSEGDFVLDNLGAAMRPWFETRYTFVKRQSSTDPNIWLRIDAASDVAVGALRR